MRLRTQAPDRAFTIIEMLVAVGVVGILVALSIPVVRAAQDRARATTSRSNLRQIVLAHLSYESDHGRLPGLASVDSGGNSWPMRIAPYASLARASFVEAGPPPGIFLVPGVEAEPVSLANWGTHTAYARNMAFVQTWEGPGLERRQPATSVARLADVPTPSKSMFVSEWKPRNHWLPWVANHLNEFPGINGGGYQFAFCDGHVERFAAGAIPNQSNPTDPLFRDRFWDPRHAVLPPPLPDGYH